MSSLSYSDVNAPDEVLLNTIGRFDPRFETRIAGPDNQACPVDIVGEIQARGNCTLRRYWGNEEADGGRVHVRWLLKTGDPCRATSGWQHRAEGRNSEMIKSAGYNVYPREVEQILGDPSEGRRGRGLWNSRCRLFRARRGRDRAARYRGSTTEADLVAWCRTQLARYKLPRAFLMSESLPRLPNGKLDRPAVRRLGERIEQTA